MFDDVLFDDVLFMFMFVLFFWGKGQMRVMRLGRIFVWRIW